MKQNYYFLFVLFFIQLTGFSQTHAHVYSQVVGGNAYESPVNELTNFSTCQALVGVDVNGYNWAGWDVTYDFEVNGNIIASGLTGQHYFDLTPYIPVNSVRMIATSGNGWIEMIASIGVLSPIATMPATAPEVSDSTIPFGATPIVPTVSLTGNGQVLKWYDSISGGTPSFTAPTTPTNEAGTITYYVSQADASGCESIRVPVRVTVEAPEDIAHLGPLYCGITIPAANSMLYANLVAGAQAYRFRVTDTWTNQMVTRDCVVRSLRLSSLPIFGYGREYKIEVAVKRNNSWSAFGTSCFVNTPMIYTSVNPAQCGNSVGEREFIDVNLVPHAAGYVFRVVNQTTGSQEFTQSESRSVRFSSLADYEPSTTYGIMVAVVNPDGTYLPFGPECFVYTGAEGEIFRIDASPSVTQSFEITAYPNPFADQFELTVNASGNVDIQVYDMLGRNVESRKMAVNGTNTESFGSTILQSGIYNVVVSNGNETKTLRMIKR